MAPVKPGLLKQSAAPKAPPTRVKNAKFLRKAYVEIQASPDGMDPEPLTLPKCVECGHCGWPVDPRDSKVATKKTWARAGIVRKSKKEELEEKLEARGEEDDEAIEEEEAEEAGSEDSRDTAEKLQDELEDLKEKMEAMESAQEELENENKALKEELDETKDLLEKAEEKIEFLEEAQIRWRDKLTASKKVVERTTHELEQERMTCGDRTTALVNTILDLRALREKHNRLIRRKGRQLEGMEQKLCVRDGIEAQSLALWIWRKNAALEHKTRDLEDLDDRRLREGREYILQLTVERTRISALEAAVQQMAGRLRSAAHRLLDRALNGHAWPSSQAHAMKCWVAAYPALKSENEFESLQRLLEETQLELSTLEERFANLEALQENTLKERDAAREEIADLKSEMHYLKQELEQAGLGSNATKASIEARIKAEKDKEDAYKKAISDAEEKIANMEADWADEKEQLEIQMQVLESRLEVATAALSSDQDGGGGPEIEEAARIVPKGQGVLCVGCLKQLIHRSVKPLPPALALKGGPPGLDQERRAFFSEALGGLPNPDDALHTKAWGQKKDPYGLARLTLWPASATFQRSLERQSREKSSTMSKQASEPLLLKPTTGLPALKKGPAKVSMQRFRQETCTVGFR